MSVEPILEELESVCKNTVTWVSINRGLGGCEDGGLQRYCTSTVMVWAAVTLE
jgi:hypothetical protein